MAARRRLMEMQGLPSAYRRVEYLESSGTQYINTGVIGRQNIEANVILAFTYSSDNARILGSRENSGATRFYLVSRVDNKWHMGISSDFMSQRTDVVIGQKYNVSARAVDNQITMLVDETELISGLTAYTGTTYPMYLFAANNYGTATGFAYLKLYSAKIWQNGVPVRNFVSCIRKSDSKPGMYDTVSKTFYTNAGTGEFIIPS